MANNVSNVSQTFIAEDLGYPTPTNFTKKFERSFYDARNQTFKISLNITSETVFINDGNSNSTGMSVTLFTKNAIFHTLAVYWTSFLGLTDVFEGEYTVSTLITPVKDKRL